jgi:hypothetical protein
MSNQNYEDITAPGWYLISSSIEQSFVNVIKQYATNKYPDAKYTFYDNAYTIPQGWTEDQGNATFTNSDWQVVSNINDPNVKMKPSLGFWIKILTYNSNEVINQVPALIGTLNGIISISTDGEGWENINEFGGTSIGNLPTTENYLPYFRSTLFQGKSSINDTNNNLSIYVSIIKNKSSDYDYYNSEIYQLKMDKSVTKVKTFNKSFIYSNDSLTTPSGKYMWLSSGYSYRYSYITPTPFYNYWNESWDSKHPTYTISDITLPNGNVISGTDWGTNDSSGPPLWQISNMSDTTESPYLYLPAFTDSNSSSESNTNNKYYINYPSASNSMAVGQFFPFNVNSQYITSANSSGDSYYVLACNGYLLSPGTKNNGSGITVLTLNFQYVSSCIYYINVSEYDNIADLVASSQTGGEGSSNTPWYSAFSYTLGPKVKLFPTYVPPDDATDSAYTSAYNLVEGMIPVDSSGTGKGIVSLVHKEMFSTDTFPVSISDESINRGSALYYAELDHINDWKIVNLIDIGETYTCSDGTVIIYVAKIFWLESANLWYISCLDKNKACVLLKTTNILEPTTWKKAYSESSLFPIATIQVKVPNNDQIVNEYYKVDNIIKNQDDNNTYIVSINGNIVSSNSYTSTGTYYSTIDSQGMFATFTESLPTSIRNNTFSSIISQPITDTIIEIKNNEPTTIIPSLASIGYAMNFLVVAGGGNSGQGGYIEKDPNNSNKSIIHYSSSGAGGSSSTLIYGNSQNCSVEISQEGKVSLNFYEDGTLILNVGNSGKTYSDDNSSYVASGGTVDTSSFNIYNNTSTQEYIKNYESYTGLNGTSQKTVNYNNTTDEATINAAKYAPDGGDPGIVTTDLAGGNNYGIGGSGSSIIDVISGGNAYVLVNYVKWEGSQPLGDKYAYTTKTTDSNNNSITKNYKLSSNANDYPMLIELTDFTPTETTNGEGTLLFNYPTVSGKTANIFFHGGAGGGGGGATTSSGSPTSNIINSNQYTNLIIERNYDFGDGPTPGWSGSGIQCVQLTQDQLIENLDTNNTNYNITDFVYNFNIGKPGIGGIPYDSNNEEKNNGSDGSDSVLTIKQNGTSITKQIPASGGKGGIGGYYSNLYPQHSTYNPSSSGGVPYGSRGSFPPLVQYTPNKSNNTKNFNIPGGVVYDNILVWQSGGFGGGGTLNNIGQGGRASIGGLPGLLNDENNSLIHGAHGGGGGGGSGGGSTATKGGNGSYGAAYLYLTGPFDYSYKSTIDTSFLFTLDGNVSVQNRRLAANFSMPEDYKYFNFAIYGGGGNGAQTNSGIGIYSGGGSGAFIHAKNIPYELNGSIIKEINYDIGVGGQDEKSTSVYITYSDVHTITLQSFAGKSALKFAGFDTSAGGTTYVDNKSLWDDSDSSNNLIQANGKHGGEKNEDAVSNSYTSPGAGGTDQQPNDAATAANNEFTGDDGKKYPISSQGGGKDTIVSGYGAGGAATPANYKSNAQQYEKGAPGCLLYYLTKDITPEPEPEPEPVDVPDIVVYNATLDENTGEYNYNSNNIYTTLSLSNQTGVAKAPFDFDRVDNNNKVYYVIQFNSTYSSNIGFIIIGQGGSGGTVKNANQDGGSTLDYTGACGGGGAGGWSQIEFNKQVVSKGTKLYITWDRSNWHIMDNPSNFTWDIWAGSGKNGQDLSVKFQENSGGGEGGRGGNNGYDGSISKVRQLDKGLNGADGVNLEYGGGIVAHSGISGDDLITLYDWTSSNNIPSQLFIQKAPGSGAGGGKGANNGTGGSAYTDSSNKNGGDGEGAGNGGGGAYKNDSTNDSGPTGGAGKVGGLMIYYNTGS